MAYAITKAGVRWFLYSYPMPVPPNLMALYCGLKALYIQEVILSCEAD